jgi:CspA family cold shock protein
MIGIVKWFNNPLGYGFIRGDGDRDILVHHSIVQKPGYRTLREGEQVAYEAIETPQGPRAVTVVPVDGQERCPTCGRPK